ncbi:hypothetical protein EGW08_001470, partial [Elysia chlorotica]
MFSLRIVTTSQYQAAPISGLDTTTSEFRGSNVKRVPVLRIFGSTPAGQKTCMHIHGVFPYLYVPYDGTQPADRYLRQFAASLDKALNVANRSASANQQHVFKISIVSGIPMYGYHPDEEQFLKIYLYNPNNVRKAADLLLGGAVMNKPFQPHESHIPYALQLFIDYNLYGMNLVHVAALKFRQQKKDVIDNDETKTNASSQNNVSNESLLRTSRSSPLSSMPENHIWNVENIPSELLLPASVERQSVCELEVDVVAADIQNRHELTSSIGANPGLSSLWEDERQRRRDAGESSQIEPEISQERHGVIPSESETELLKQFLTLVKEQQEIGDSQSNRSLLSQSLPASQLERHISRQDSLSSSEGTVILDENEETIEDKDEANKPIISLDSIKKVVSFSQSFSSVSSHRDSQDSSVADILASLLEEAGPPPSQITSLEEKDSVLNQSVVRDDADEEEEDEETLLMSQSLCQTDKDEGLPFEPEELGSQQDKIGNAIEMDTDEDNDDEDIDLLPQFDGASDNVSSDKKATDTAQNMVETSAQNPPFPKNPTHHTPSQMTADSSLMPEQDTNSWGEENSQKQGYSSDHNSESLHHQQQCWPGQVNSNWHGQNSVWQQQQQHQQRFHNWSPHHQPQVPAYAQQQVPYRATSPFHSPSHNSFASQSHASSGFQTPSPSISQHRSPFQYSGYIAQSPSSSQQQYVNPPFQSPYQSPTSSNHSYQQSPQPYQSPTTPGPQTYQSPLPYSGKAYPSGASYQNTGYQSSPGNQLYQSPTYHSSSSNGGQVYQSPYQSPHQSCPPSYSSPGYHSQQQPGWSPQYFPPGHPGLSQHQQQASPTNFPPGSAPHPQAGRGTSASSADHTSPQLIQSSKTFPAIHPSPCQTEDHGKKTPKSQKLHQQNPPMSSQENTSQSKIRATFDKNEEPGMPSEQSDGLKTLQGNSEKQIQNPTHSQKPSYARALPPTNSCAQDSGLEQLEKTNVAKSNQTSIEKSSLSSPSNKISTLDFNPITNKTSTPSASICEKMDEKPAGVDASATPMIQQLLMEESPARKNIKQKDRLAVAAAGMRKPMLSPSPPKPKKKLKVKSSPQGAEAKPQGRPRSASASSRMASGMDFQGGLSPQQAQAKPGRTQSISSSFNNDPRMAAPPQGYGWGQPAYSQPQQIQWPQSYPAWQQPQHYQHQQTQQQSSWGNSQWQNFTHTPPYGNTSAAHSSNNQTFTPARMQNRSFSADASLSTSYAGSMMVRHPSQSDSQSDDQGNCIDNSGSASWRQDPSEAKGDLIGDVKDTSSLSSLLQLVSDVGSSSDETGWDHSLGPSKAQPNGNIEVNSKKSTPNSESTNQPSPSLKDFITLETPARLGENSNGNGLSSGELDQTEESASEIKLPSKVHPRLGKQNRLKRIGPKLTRPCEFNSREGSGINWAGSSQPRSSDSGYTDGSCSIASPNPWYTYTFHVPTPVFKKLKFYQSAKARRQTVKVVRMHPMDARRYSLLKIGREVVRVARLTPEDLTRYNVTFPSSSRYVSPDGSSNRVNLDIPSSSGDSHNGEGGAEENSISFDTDFPPNKVAPPSSFDSSHVTVSVQRSVAQSGSRGSPRSGSPGAAGFSGRGDWERQLPAQHQRQYGLCGYNGGDLSPRTINSNVYSGQGPGPRNPQEDFAYRQLSPEVGSLSYRTHQPMPLGNTHGRNGNVGSIGFSMHDAQKPNDNPSISPSTSGLQNTVGYGSNYHNSFTNATSYPYQHHHYQHHQQQPHMFLQSHQQTQQLQQHQHHHQQFFQPQQQADHNNSHMEQKNELRSPGQHGLASRIESEGNQSHSDVNKPNTGTLSVNTWANAHENHADKPTNVNDEVQCYKGYETSSLFHYSNEDDKGSRNSSESLPKEVCLYKKKKMRKKKKMSLSLKKMPETEQDRPQTVENLDGSANSDTDKEASSSCFTQLKTCRNGDLSAKIVLKNVKSLRLKIPRPYSECTGNNESLDFAGEEERDPVSDSLEQLSDVSSKTQDFIPEKRQMQLEKSIKKPAKQGCRQAKLRSIYSSLYLDQKKRKTRKKKQLLKEGVHYIIIGKFKGHKSMLVKIKPVPVSPGELVSAEEFEKLSYTDIIRQVIIPPEAFILSSSPSGSNLSSELPSRSERQGKQRKKFKSAFAKSKTCNSDQHVVGKESPSINYEHPKNGEAGLMRVKAVTNNNTNIVSTDVFFNKVREAYLQHTHLLNASSKESPPVEAVFFEGISCWQLSDFKKRLVQNVNSTKSDEYSSSSDEEDEILDEEILHQKVYPARMLNYSKTKSSLSRESLNSIYLGSHNMIPSDYLAKTVSESLDLVKQNYATEIYQEKSCPSSSNNVKLSIYPLHKEGFGEAKIATTSQLEKVAPERVGKDDFLKRQMAFFEDISSTSESENEIKNETEKGHMTPKCPPLRLSVGSNGIKILKSTDYEPKVSDDVKTFESRTVPGLQIGIEEEEKSKMIEPLPEHQESSKHIENDRDHSPAANAEILVDVFSPAEKLDKDKSSLIDFSKVGQMDSGNAISEKLANIDQNTNSGSEETSKIDVDTKEMCDSILHKKDKDASSNEFKDSDVPFTKCEVAEKPRAIELLNDSALKRSKKWGKNRKKSVQHKGKVPARRFHPANKESSSNDETQALEEKSSGFEKKRLRQRKQAYRFYSEDLDSSEDEIWGIKESNSGNAWNALSCPAKSIKSGHDMQETFTLGKNHCPSSSRRRKGAAGGGKLLNSLSLLHMATIANLTDVQIDSQDGSQSTSRDVASTPTEQYSDKAVGECYPEYTPSLETLSFISPKTPEEAGVSPPVAFSPTNSKVESQARSTGQSHSSRRLFHSAQHRASLKPGCNGSSNLGTRPVHFSHLADESASSSPVPSNFTANDSSVQLEGIPSVTAEQTENSTMTAGATATVHQLLETRKAQVNCASFSMKDILRLATPDDSMDSDSKDSAAVVKPPEVRRAQVRSTSLSMKDILQLTHSASPVEESNGLHHMLTKNMDADTQLHKYESEQISMVSLSHHNDAKSICAKSHHNIATGMKKYNPNSSNSVSGSASGKAHTEQPEDCIQKSGNITPQEEKINQGKKEKDTKLKSFCFADSVERAKNSESKEPVSHSISNERLISCASSSNSFTLDRKYSDIRQKQDETDGDGIRNDSSQSATESDVSHNTQNKMFASSSSCLTLSSVSNVAKLPEISVTCEDKEDMVKRQKTCHSLSNQALGLNPLHPLQIPTFPYLTWPPAHPYPSAPASDSPMYRHASYWQMLAQPGSSTSSPLNLCTTSHRSPNNYSPITPTSPVSPYYPNHSSMFPPIHASSVSPPTKKTKPLWYPWLNVESVKKNTSSQPLLSPSVYGSKKENLSQKKDNKLVTNEKDATKPPCLSHSIADLLANPTLKKSSRVNAEAMSSCETVSQFLGSVIDTAYNRHIKRKHVSLSRDTDKISGQQLSNNTRPSSVPDSSNFTGRNTQHRKGATGFHQCQEKHAISQRQCFNQISNEMTKEFSEPFSGVRKGEADRVRAMLENEVILRGHFGLPPLRPMASFSNVLRSDNQSLTERLVSQLIKGSDQDKINKEPVDGSRGRKRAAGPSRAPDTGSGSSHSNTYKRNAGSARDRRYQGRDDGEDEGRDAGKQKVNSSLDKGRNLTIRPAISPPRRKSVEETLQDYGLNSIQPPSAFCSNKQDLPDKPMEHGGRVLKVESNRFKDIATFPCSKQLVGLESWRGKSLGKPGPHSRVLREKVDLPDNSRQLHLLLEPERRIVAGPVLAPPARETVLAWLNSQTALINEMKQKEDSSNSLTETNLGDGHKYVKFSQHLVSAPEKNASSAELINLKKFEGGNQDLASPPSSGLSMRDNSTCMVDTDLDVTLTPNQTQTCPSSSTSGDTTYESQASIEDVKSDKFPQSSTGDKKQKKFPNFTQTADVHLRKSKRRIISTTSSGKAKEARLSVASSTVNVPLSPTDVINSSSKPEADSSRCSAACEQPESSEEDAAGQVTPLLRRLSTNTENLIRRNVLSTQTQRQYSELGFTAGEMSQIEGPTPKNTFGFKMTPNQKKGFQTRHKFQNITTLSLELHVETRGDLRPDPELDPVQAVFYSVLDDVPADRGKSSTTGIIYVDAQSWTKVMARKQNQDHLSSQKPKSGFCQGNLFPTSKSPTSSCSSTSKPNQVIQNTPPSSPKAVASQSLSPKPKRGGKGRGKGRANKASGQSPGRAYLSPDQALLEKSSVGRNLEITYVQDEMHLLGTTIDLVKRFDPDILVGYEIQTLSWGFLLQRAAHLGLDLCSKIARVQDSKENNQFSAAKDEWGADHMSEIHVSGRVVLNLWRVIRHEVALNVYSFENVAFHILHQRIPLYSFRSLTKWFSHRTHLLRWRVLEYYIVRVKGQLEVIDSLDLIGKTSEFARVFGIEFYDVLARGSQIRVESMMLRLAKPLNFVPVSPSVHQRARQRAPECIPLTLEPESQLYTSPVVVLDFQSLYPSIMIAYNYCFSTCLGRLSCLENAHEGPFEFGCTSMKVTPASLKKIKDSVTVSPNGVVFLKSNVRRGVLPRMVEEILNTRIMVKKSMKAVKDDKTMSRMLDARQLGLKLIANVTYGYTGASFSGRMPCVEVGDSIVRKARESLERSIELVRNTPRWGAQVVYGDTDSLFIHFPGKSKDEAFTLGHEIADAVTAIFPSPMKLKFEKVYLPCVLQTKKRYVGYMYETPDQKEPVFDAKGIETVRRDSCSAVSKILERSIKVMFSTHDLSRVRAYVTRQLHKLLEGKVSVLDLIFAKEFRGSFGYKPGACVPALEIARRRMRIDRRWEPRVGERVPYVVIHGPPGLPLIQLVREPHELTVDPSLRLNATYYITKQILPPLDRFFSLIGVNVYKWYQDMPKVVRLSPMIGIAPSVKQGTISQFFATTDCPVCEVQTKKPVCEKCTDNPQVVSWTILSRTRAWERTYSRLMEVCTTCQGTQDAGDQICISTDCPVMFRRIIARQDLTRADNLKDVLKKY